MDELKYTPRDAKEAQIATKLYREPPIKEINKILGMDLDKNRIIKKLMLAGVDTIKHPFLAQKILDESLALASNSKYSHIEFEDALIVAMQAKSEKENRDEVTETLNINDFSESIKAIVVNDKKPKKKNTYTGSFLKRLKFLKNGTNN